MISFTFDTNCIIAVAEERPEAAYIGKLLEAGAANQADLALVASSASERQTDHTFLTSFAVFEELRKSLGFGSLPLLQTIGRYNVAFFGASVFASTEDVAREASIFEILFPSSPYHWSECAAVHNVDKNDQTTPAYLRWRNKLLDAQAIWAHDHAGRYVFVTSDKRLKAIDGHPDFSGLTIKTPEEAASML